MLMHSHNKWRQAAKHQQCCCCCCCHCRHEQLEQYAHFKSIRSSRKLFQDSLFSLMFHVLMIMKLSSFAINKIYSSEFEDLCKESFLCLQNEMILLESQPVGAAWIYLFFIVGKLWIHKSKHDFFIWQWYVFRIFPQVYCDKQM